MAAPVHMTLTVTERGTWNTSSGKGSVKCSFSSGLEPRIPQIDVVMDIADQDLFDEMVIGAQFDVSVSTHVTS